MGIHITLRYHISIALRHFYLEWLVFHMVREFSSTLYVEMNNMATHHAVNTDAYIHATRYDIQIIGNFFEYAWEQWIYYGNDTTPPLANYTLQNSCTYHPINIEDSSFSAICCSEIFLSSQCMGRHHMSYSDVDCMYSSVGTELLGYNVTKI